MKNFDQKEISSCNNSSGYCFGLFYGILHDISNMFISHSVTLFLYGIHSDSLSYFGKL